MEFVLLSELIFCSYHEFYCEYCVSTWYFIDRDRCCWINNGVAEHFSDKKRICCDFHYSCCLWRCSWSDIFVVSASLVVAEVVAVVVVVVAVGVDVFLIGIALVVDRVVVFCVRDRVSIFDVHKIILCVVAVGDSELLVT